MNQYKSKISKLLNGDKEKINAFWREIKVTAKAFKIKKIKNLLKKEKLSKIEKSFLASWRRMYGDNYGI